MVHEALEGLEQPTKLRRVDPDGQLCPSSGRPLRVDSWAAALSDLPDRDTFIDRLRDHIRTTNNLDRPWIAGLTDDVQRLAASTIWGFGNYVWRGRKFLREQLAREHHSAIREIAEACRKSPRDGFTKLFVDGQPRVPYLGVAYGTKFLYFTSRSTTSTWSLIYDKRVHNGLVRVQQDSHHLHVPSLADRVSKTSADNYQDYVDFAVSLDAERPDRVEYLLFEFGK